MMGAMMIAIHEEKKGVIVLLLNVVVNVTLNLFLIPKFSLYGAALATVLTEIFYFGGYYYIISKSFYRLNIVSFLIKPTIASVLMGVTIYYLMSLNVFILVVFGILVYCVIMLLLRALNSDDMDIIKRIFVEKKV